MIMALDKSEAILLKSFNWSESSRTVVFFTRKFGKMALFDKGGRRLKNKRGRIQSFARMEITFYNSEKETSGYISDIDLLEQFSLEKDGSLGRLAYVSAACELLHQLLPEEEPQERLYNLFCKFLSLSDKTKKRYLPALFIIFALKILSQLGYQPSLSYCAGCSKEIKTESKTAKFIFSPSRGGIICGTCQTAGEYYIQLSSENLKPLQLMQRSSLNESESIPIGYQQAILMIEIIEEHLGFQADLKHRLKSLKFLEKLKNSQL